jgi:hypothetical protein
VHPNPNGTKPRHAVSARPTWYSCVGNGQTICETYRANPRTSAESRLNLGDDRQLAKTEVSLSQFVVRPVTAKLD